ncbi:hypothetical protein FIBSPDRAFT_964324 [Athelia psychrophila]|uniref:Uncharacterized protein n=1 Tax=Athelia psychrophila TaxID=1759441 RepID=A0A165XWR1_9AGAM|nr:hypothetical protein FIBSPDRAFT_964324 [Fibularhizoctonia sp. CBS 109695]
MATKNRKDKARKHAVEDAAVDDAVVNIAPEKQKRVMGIKHKSASLVWHFFALWRSSPTIAEYAHSVGTNAYSLQRMPPVRRREEGVGYIFEMLA